MKISSNSQNLVLGIRIFFNSYVYYLILFIAFNLATRAFSLLTRKFELVTRQFEFVTHGLELITRQFDFSTLSLCCLTLRKSILKIIGMKSHYKAESAKLA